MPYLTVVPNNDATNSLQWAQVLRSASSRYGLKSQGRGMIDLPESTQTDVAEEELHTDVWLLIQKASSSILFLQFSLLKRIIDAAVLHPTQIHNRKIFRSSVRRKLKFWARVLAQQ